MRLEATLLLIPGSLQPPVCMLHTSSSLWWQHCCIPARVGYDAVHLLSDPTALRSMLDLCSISCVLWLRTFFWASTTLCAWQTPACLHVWWLHGNKICQKYSLCCCTRAQQQQAETMQLCRYAGRRVSSCYIQLPTCGKLLRHIPTCIASSANSEFATWILPDVGSNSAEKHAWYDRLCVWSNSGPDVCKR